MSKAPPKKRPRLEVLGTEEQIASVCKSAEALGCAVNHYLLARHEASLGKETFEEILKRISKDSHNRRSAAKGKPGHGRAGGLARAARAKPLH
jgi:hypothetical protein